MKSDAAGFIYTLSNNRESDTPNGAVSKIFVRNRPRSFSQDCEASLADEDKADAYLSVTDTFTTSPSDKICMWFPWNEGRSPIPEMFYATNKALCWWVFYRKLTSIQVFCDGGTHRSVTVFGAFLRTYFTEQEAIDIVNKRVPVGYFGNNGLSDQADPLRYIDLYLEQFPADRLLFKAMNQDWLGRLEDYSKDIYNLVKARYGDQK